MTDPYARYTRLKFDRPHAKVLRITMENGRMNTTDEALHRELAEIWRDVDRDASVNAAIITGVASPLMMLRINASISSWNISRCSIVRCSASCMVMGMIVPLY